MAKTLTIEDTLGLIYVFIALSGIIGNSFVLFMYVTKMGREEMEARYFIPILAVFDLIVCVLAETYVIELFLPLIGLLISDVSCKVFFFFMLFNTAVSNALLLTIAVQRYLKVCRPLQKQMDLFWRRLITLIEIAVCSIYAVPTLFVSGITSSSANNGMNDSVNISTPECSPTNYQYPAFQAIFYFVIIFLASANLLATIGVYTPILFAVYRHFHSRNKNTKQTDRDYTMIIQGKETNAKQKSTPVQEEIEMVSINRYLEDGAKRDGPQKSVGKTQMQNKQIIQPKSNVQQKHKRPATNFNMMFFCIIFIYVVSYVPFFVSLIIIARSKTDYTGFIQFLSGIYVIDHAANPFVYAYFDKRMREKVVNCFKKKHKQ